ncbi:gamma-glutamyltranspeptidase/glutathione hydrolase [Rhizobium aquaticum]|uniref:Glutathione hydrolase proenzyme n=1 Tax=Rhizobium aquaticum TaxID=1549636 RepID=A0ABV2J5K4_9HYPH
MVATAHPAASAAALTVLQSGGNAFDAAICAALVLSVVEPQSSGLGGDSFVLGYSSGVAKPFAINGSGKSGKGGSADELRRRGFNQMPMRGAMSVTCPGAVDTWAMLHRDHGQLDWGRLFEPAIRFAREGYIVADRVALDWWSFEDALSAGSGAGDVFLKGGRAFRAGQVHRQPCLASTLERIASGGRDAFYEGPVAQDIIETLGRLGSFIEAADLAETRAFHVTPVSLDYKGYDVLQLPSNNQGSTALLLLNILKHLPQTEHSNPQRFHFLLEAARLAYRERDRALGDPEFSAIDQAKFTDDAFAAELAAMIDPDRTTKVFGEPQTRKSDTTTISVVDRVGNAVTLINSLYYHFGSCVVAPLTGILLQNRGSGFNLLEGHPNEFAPAKRPLHTIMPGLVLKNGKPALIYGVMGGDYQAIGHAQLIADVVDFGLDIQQAIDRPRAFYFKGFAEVERSMPAHIVEGLTRRGHSVQVAHLPIGGAQAIWIDPASGTLSGGSDPRKDGLAIGN